MSRARQRTPEQQAIVDLRQAFGYTQQELALSIGVTVVTVCRWETSRPPSGISLVRLASTARGLGLKKIEAIFEKALAKDPRRRILRQPEPAVLIAIREIRESLDIQVIGRQFLKILQAVKSTHALLIRQALSDGMETESYRRLKRTHQNLEWELEDEQKRTQTER